MRICIVVGLVALMASTSACKKQKQCRPGFELIHEGGAQFCRDPAYEARKAAAAQEELARPPAPIASPPEVAATKLWSDYHDNEIAADMQYKGKRLLVSGTVDSVDKDFSGKPYLYLESGDVIRRVPVRFRVDESAKLATLKRGSPFRAVCTCEGKKIGSPDLVDCSAL